MAALTPIKKQHLQQRKTLERACTSVKSAWSFQMIKKWSDVYKHLGYAESYVHANFTNRNEGLTFPELKSYLESLLKEMDDRHKKELQQPAIKENESRQSTSIRDLAEVKAINEQATSEIVNYIRNGNRDNGSKESYKVKDTAHPSDVVLDAIAEAEETEEFNAKNNYGLVRSPMESTDFDFYWFQKKAISQGYRKIVIEKKPGILILSGTGSGKTLMQDGLIRRLIDADYHEGKTFSHIPYLVITKATIVEQHKRVLKKWFNINPVEDMEVMNIEQLRSSKGALWVKEEVKIVEGEEVSNWIWKKNTHPCVVFFDESQGAKNTGSTQSKIMCSYSEIPKNACLVSISATPFTRVSEAKCFAISTKRSLDHLGFPKGTVLCNDTWPTYAKYMADPMATGKGKPTDYNEAAVARLMADLEDYVVRVKGVRPQFDAENSVEFIDFETPQKRAFYEAAWERFLAELAKLKKAELDDGAPSGNYIFTILLKFAMAAELCHADHFAKDMYDCVQRGKAAVFGGKFKQTHREVVRLLVYKYGVSRDLISMVWGGGQTQLTKKQKAKNKIKSMEGKLAEADIDVNEMLTDLNLEDVEDREIVVEDPILRLGPQDADGRQRNIDDFQSGKTHYMLFTYKAGGVGLSLPHTDEMTEFKCRRKPSGYVIEEDIPKVPTRQRETFLTLTYNAIELVQGVGRVPRINSLSRTRQRAFGYKGTIEVDIGTIVSQKLRCLSSIVKMRESWQDVIIASSNERKTKVQQILATTAEMKEESAVMIDTSEEEDDE